METLLIIILLIVFAPIAFAIVVSIFGAMFGGSNNSYTWKPKPRTPEEWLASLPPKTPVSPRAIVLGFIIAMVFTGLVMLAKMNGLTFR